jgi:hypothetical protein
MNLAMAYATLAARLPTGAVCAALFVLGTPVKCPFTKPKTASANKARKMRQEETEQSEGMAVRLICSGNNHPYRPAPLA